MTQREILDITSKREFFYALRRAYVLGIEDATQGNVTQTKPPRTGKKLLADCGIGQYRLFQVATLRRVYADAWRLVRIER